jgi:hypothetical protein
VPTAGLLLGQVIKHRAGRCLTGVTRRVVRGTEAAIAAVLAATVTGTGINTAYIKRLNATFRGAVSRLTRRGRAIARGADALTVGMDLVPRPAKTDKLLLQPTYHGFKRTRRLSLDF